MANKLGILTIGNVLVISSDTDPSKTGGLDAPAGSFGSAIDGSGMFYKSGVTSSSK